MIEIISFSRDGKIKKDGEPTVMYHVRFNGRERSMTLSDLGKFSQNVLPEEGEEKPQDTPLFDTVSNGR